MDKLSRLCRKLRRLTGRQLVVNRGFSDCFHPGANRYQVFETVNGVFRCVFHSGTCQAVERFILDQFI